MKKILFAALIVAAPAFAQNNVPGQHFVENWDLDQDGAVTVAEATERRGDVFYSFDHNEDGFLDAEEYGYFDEARALDMENMPGHGHGQGAVQQAADGMAMQANDLDGDGLVSRDEFVGSAAAWVATMDRTGDGVVTTADFGPGRG
jgi:hypothetical protein